MEQELQETTQPAAAPQAVQANSSLQNGQRKRLLFAVLAAFVSGAIAYGAYWALAGRYVEFTDDAYVNGNIVQITPQVSGTVVAIGADDTSFVKSGETLVQLDQADAKVALE